MSTVAVIGCGQAGASAAKHLKSISPETSVLIFDTLPYGLYAKIRMPEFIAGAIPESKLVLSAPDALEKIGVEAHCSEKIIALDTEKHEIRSQNGKVFGYDALLLATGASASLPPVPGLDTAKRVKTLRVPADAHDIISLAQTSKDALVMGGGLLGLEGAWALHEKGLEVTVIEYMNRLLPKQLSEKQSAELLKQFEAMSFHVLLSAAAEKVVNSEDGRVCVTLCDGRQITADMMLVSAGIRPEITLACSAGILCGRGIKVDHALKTSKPDVFAAGDCAEIDGRTAGLWMAAKDQGEAAAEIIAGVRKSFEPPVYSPRLKVAGIDFREIGQIK